VEFASLSFGQEDDGVPCTRQSRSSSLIEPDGNFVHMADRKDDMHVKELMGPLIIYCNHTHLTEFRHRFNVPIYADQHYHRLLSLLIS